MIVKLDHPDAIITITTPHNEGHSLAETKIDYEMKSPEEKGEMNLRELVENQLLWEFQSCYGLYGHTFKLNPTRNTDLKSAVNQIVKRYEDAARDDVSVDVTKLNYRASMFIHSSKDGYFDAPSDIAEIIRKTLPFKLIEIDTGGVEFKPYEFPEGSQS